MTTQTSNPQNGLPQGQTFVGVGSPHFACSTVHSSSLSNTVAGASGMIRGRSRRLTTRAATAEYNTSAFVKRSHASNRNSLIRQPLFSVRWNSSIGYRQVYFRTTSQTSSAVVAGSRVQIHQHNAVTPLGGSGSQTSISVHVIDQA